MQQTEPADLLSILSGAGDAEKDALPKIVDDARERDGAELRVTRFLGETASGRYWVGVDERGEICVFAEQKLSQHVSINCQSLQRFRLDGASAGGSGSYKDEEGNYRTDHTELFVVPDGYAPVEIPEGLELIQPNVLAGEGTGGDHWVSFRSEGTGRQIKIPR
ncbi:hypothetical protein [Glutamicibacter sp. PS]|uniref:hypothetical protein n=1 Tax=Glutamicibacter TaxID=1742989 RepID=UPI00284D8349|nr:hypothetical protein [Glutamicibacter sp. PS]MDR4534189.1 hypothetical protein [Glutamicibacter sp. PS]